MTSVVDAAPYHHLASITTTSLECLKTAGCVETWLISWLTLRIINIDASCMKRYSQLSYTKCHHNTKHVTYRDCNRNHNDNKQRKQQQQQLLLQARKRRQCATKCITETVTTLKVVTHWKVLSKVAFKSDLRKKLSRTEHGLIVKV